MAIEFANESGYAGVHEEMLIDIASFALAHMDISPEAEATIYAVDLATIEDMHVRWMDLAGPTDVMSFPMDEVTPGASTGSLRPDAPAAQDGFGPAMLGDIVLCPEFAERQAQAAGHSLGHELALLTVHGVLHLLGYDHATPAQEKEMFGLQNELLANWYDDLAARGVDYQPKPSGPRAFPSAADRADLDREVAGGGIPPVGEPAAQPGNPDKNAD